MGISSKTPEKTKGAAIPLREKVEEVEARYEEQNNEDEEMDEDDSDVEMFWGWVILVSFISNFPRHAEAINSSIFMQEAFLKGYWEVYERPFNKWDCHH